MIAILPYKTFLFSEFSFDLVTSFILRSNQAYINLPNIIIFLYNGTILLVLNLKL